MATLSWLSFRPSPRTSALRHFDTPTLFDSQEHLANASQESNLLVEYPAGDASFEQVPTSHEVYQNRITHQGWRKKMPPFGADNPT